jgi:hypothetical protein
MRARFIANIFIFILLTLLVQQRTHAQELTDAITGRVIDERGQGLAGVPVFLSQENNIIASAESGPDGEFEFTTEPGEYLVQVRGEPAWRLVSEAPQVTVGAAPISEVTFRFETKALVDAVAPLVAPLHEAVAPPPMTFKWAAPAGEAPTAYELAYRLGDGAPRAQVVEGLELTIDEEGPIWWQVRPLYSGNRVGRWSAPWMAHLSTTVPPQEGSVPAGQILPATAAIVEATSDALPDVASSQQAVGWQQWLLALFPLVLLGGGIWAFRRPQSARLAKGDS